MNRREKLAKKACQGLAKFFGFDYAKIADNGYVTCWTVDGACTYLLSREPEGILNFIYGYVTVPKPFTWVQAFEQMSGSIISAENFSDHKNREIEVGSLDEFLIRLELENCLYD